jgi:hypothetical protein
MIAAVLICALMLITAIAGHEAVSLLRQPARGRHAIGAPVIPAPDEAAQPPALPQRPDPVLTVPRWRGGPSLALLARVYAGLLPRRPAPAATFEPAPPDDTVTDLPAWPPAGYLAAPR